VQESTTPPAFEEFHGLSPRAQQFVREYAGRRGITSAQLGEYLAPQPDDGGLPLPETAWAVARLEQALRLNQTVVIYGDYDCDGITATTLLTRFLRDCGSTQIHWELPNRHKDQYGLTPPKAAQLLEARRPDLLIALNCGTNAHDSLLFLKRNDVDTLVIDHHPLEGNGCPAGVLLNPKNQATASEELRDLCTAGLTLRFCETLAKAWQCQERWDRDGAVALAGLGTLGDACRLTLANRALIKQSLALLNDPAFMARNLGLSALLRGQGSGRFDQRSAQFHLIPRLNALGRLASAELGVELLLTQDASVAAQIAAQAAGMNSLRQELQQRLVDSACAQARAQLNRQPALELLVLSHPEWHHGVVGPAASRVVEAFGRSALLLAIDSEGRWRGSGRAHQDHNLGELVRVLKSAGLLTSGGGHAAAVGVTLSATQLPRLHHAVSQLSMPKIPKAEAATEILGDSGRLTPGEWSRVFRLLEPFGPGNPQPLLTASGCRLQSSPVPLRLKNGRVWAARGEFISSSGQRLTVLARDPAKAESAWLRHKSYDFLLELSIRVVQGTTYHSWIMR
jgi:single-stranded-DNA-specific exonuclease